MTKDGKPKIIHEGTISVIRGDEFPKLTPDEQMTVDSLQRKMEKSEARKAAKEQIEP